MKFPSEVDGKIPVPFFLWAKDNRPDKEPMLKTWLSSQISLQWPLTILLVINSVDKNT